MQLLDGRRHSNAVGGRPEGHLSTLHRSARTLATVLRSGQFEAYRRSLRLPLAPRHAWPSSRART
eukprot:7978413-Pyramimonas_sp.AAC.1